MAKYLRKSVVIFEPSEMRDVAYDIASVVVDYLNDLDGDERERYLKDKIELEDLIIQQFEFLAEDYDVDGITFVSREGKGDYYAQGEDDYRRYLRKSGWMTYIIEMILDELGRKKEAMRKRSK